MYKYVYDKTGKLFKADAITGQPFMEVKPCDGHVTVDMAFEALYPVWKNKVDLATEKMKLVIDYPAENWSSCPVVQLLKFKWYQFWIWIPYLFNRRSLRLKIISTIAEKQFDMKFHWMHDDEKIFEHREEINEWFKASGQKEE